MFDTREIEFKMLITKSKIDKLTFPQDRTTNQVRYYDEKLKGFGIRVTPKGAKSFFVEKKINNKLRRKTLGSYPALTVEIARNEAQKLLGQIATGIDPYALAETNKRKQFTLEQVYKDYLEARKALKPTTIKDYNRLMKESFADWSSKPLLQITKDMIANRHKALGENSQARSNLSMRLLRALFNFAAGQYEDENGVSLVLENPVNRLSHTRGWYKVKTRQSIIKKHELPDWLNAVFKVKNESARSRAKVTCNYLLFTLFTGLRRTEAATLKWDDIDYKAESFTVQDTKNHQNHTLPITPFLKEILSEQHEKRKNEFVFPSFTGKGPITEPRKIMVRVSELSGISFTLHDLRRTFITVAESLDIPAYALKRLLNHKSNNSDITGGYIVIDVERLREPMITISNYFTKMIER